MIRLSYHISPRMPLHVLFTLNTATQYSFSLHFSIRWGNKPTKLGIIWLASKHSLRLSWSVYPQTQEFKVKELDHCKVQPLSTCPLIFYTQNGVLEPKFPFLSKGKVGISEPIFQKSDVT